MMLSATAHPVVKDLLDANELVRVNRRSAAQSLHSHSVNESVAATCFWCMCRCKRSFSTGRLSDRRLRDNSGHRKDFFGHRQEDDVTVMAWRSFKLPRKIAGSSRGETHALSFADESLWLARLAWSHLHGASTRRWHLNETVRQVGGTLTTDSRSISVALTRSE